MQTCRDTCRGPHPTLAPPPPLPSRISIGWQRRRQTHRSLRELGNQVTGYFDRLRFSAVIITVVELSHIVRGGESHPVQRG